MFVEKYEFLGDCKSYTFIGPFIKDVTAEGRGDMRDRERSSAAV